MNLDSIAVTGGHSPLLGLVAASLDGDRTERPRRRHDRRRYDGITTLTSLTRSRARQLRRTRGTTARPAGRPA